MTVIDEAGNQLTWTAVYWRYHSQFDYEADSLEEALRFLGSGEEHAELSSDCVLGPDGEVLIPRDQIRDVLFEFREATAEERSAMVLELTSGGDS